MPLTTTQYEDAVQQMIVHCKLVQENGAYEPISARGCLRTLGFDGEELDEVLHYIASRGFTYCLDSRVKQEGAHNDYPPQFACWWGPDQLESRLRAVAR